MIHNEDTVLTLSDTFDIHGEHLTFKAAIDRGLITAELDGDKVVTYVRVNPNPGGFISEGEVTEGANAGTTFKQS